MEILQKQAVSLTYFSLGTENRRIFRSQAHTVQIDQISTKDLCISLDNVFTKQKNITFDWYIFRTRKQLKGEPVEKFYGGFRELFLNCDRGSHGKSLIRIVFIAKMQVVLNTTRTVKRDKDGQENLGTGNKHWNERSKSIENIVNCGIYCLQSTCQCIC